MASPAFYFHVGAAGLLLGLAFAACRPMTGAPPITTLKPGRSHVETAAPITLGTRGATPERAAPDTKRPNVVFVLLDDLDAHATKPYYRDVLPRSMALADEGVRFDNAFVTTPLCCPARAGFLSGCYGHNTRVLNNGGDFGGRGQFRDDEARSIAAHLHIAGYRTGLFGKYLNGFKVVDGKAPPLPWGFTDGSVFVSPNLKQYRGYDYTTLEWSAGRADGADDDGLPVWRGEAFVERHGDDEEDYATDVIFEKALSFIDDAEAEDDRPFFALVAPTCPHFPIPPAPRHREAAQRFGYESFRAARPDSYYSDGEGGRLDGAADKPRWLRRTWRKRGRTKNTGGRWLHMMGGDLPDDAPGGTLGWNEVDWYNRMGSLMACDEGIASIVERLEERDEWDNTIFVFASDNGYNLGAHGLVQKLSPYEESIRVPMFVTGGADVDLRRGEHESRWVLNIDMTPTLLELAGLEVPRGMDGRSFAPLLRGDPGDVPWRNRFLVEYRGPGMANGYLQNFDMYHTRLAPAFFLDMPSYQAVRAEVDGRVYKYVWWDGYMLRRRGEQELYDLTDDPHELTNLLARRPDPEHRRVAGRLKADLVRLAQCRGQEGADACRRVDRVESL